MRKRNEPPGSRTRCWRGGGVVQRHDDRDWTGVGRPVCCLLLRGTKSMDGEGRKKEGR